jgi:hypothetical protein
VYALQWQRCSSGTPSRAASMCRPQPTDRWEARAARERVRARK